MPAPPEIRIAADVRCELGEGPLWHPQRQTLIWFDIYAQVLFENDGRGGPVRAIGFGEPVSAAGLLDATFVLVAGASGLYRLDLATGARKLLAPLEADNPSTRSNDGRAGPGGAFWIGTMGMPVAEGAGALYRYHAGGFELLRTNMTTPNAIAFSPDGTRAYFADTPRHCIFVVPLDPVTGAPVAEPDLFVDLSAEAIRPDGAVVDAEGFLWNAQIGAGRMVRYGPDGRLDRIVELPVTKPTCPAFGGPNLKTMFVTTAWQGLSARERDEQPWAGAVLAFDLDVRGAPERRVRLTG